MINGKRIAVVMPAYNAEGTLVETVRDLPDTSSISFRRSVTYGLGVLTTTAQFVTHKYGLAQLPLFQGRGRKLNLRYYSEAQHGDGLSYEEHLHASLAP